MFDKIFLCFSYCICVVLQDYLVLLPSAYYEAPILQLKVTEPCIYTPTHEPNQKSVVNTHMTEHSIQYILHQLFILFYFIEMHTTAVNTTLISCRVKTTCLVLSRFPLYSSDLSGHKLHKTSGGLLCLSVFRATWGPSQHFVLFVMFLKPFLNVFCSVVGRMNLLKDNTSIRENSCPEILT